MRGILKFLRDDRGLQTIAFLLWVPIFVALLVIVIDASTLYLTQTEMWNVARDTARRMTTGALKTESQVRVYANSQLHQFRNNTGLYTVDASFDPVVVVAISIGAGDISFTGFRYLGYTIFGGPISAQVVMRPEPS